MAWTTELLHLHRELKNVLTLNYSKTEFPLIGLQQQLGKIHTLNTIDSARILGFIFDSHLTFSDQISSLSLSLVIITFVNFAVSAPILTSASTIATSIVHSKLDNCNSQHYNLPKSQTNRLQVIQNSLARAVVNAPEFCHVTPILKSLHWLHERIEYKLFSLTYKTLATAQPTYLHSLISVQPLVLLAPHLTFTPSRPPTSSLRITNRSFRYASPHLWNQLPVSFRQPGTKHPADDVTLTSHLLTTLTLHHTFTVPFQAQNSPFPQIFSTIVS